MGQNNSTRLINNNFDLLRLLFAGMVLLVHSYQLSGYEDLSWVVFIFSSEVAVKSFFVISGFLVFMSFERSSSVSSYAEKRIRRIYPAYFSVVVLCAVGLFFVSNSEASEYFSFLWVKYVVANLFFLNFLQPSLPGVFDSNKISAVNGALWTLKLEVMFYFVVPIFVAAFRRFGRLPVLLVFYFLSVGYCFYFKTLASSSPSGIYLELSRQLPGQLCYFLAGALIYYYIPIFERHAKYIFVISVAILFFDKSISLFVFEPIALAVVVMFFGLYFYAGNFGKYGDFSYGVYILHFPVIQLLIYSGKFDQYPLLFLFLVVAITAVAAISMWHLVEKKFLLRKSHYVLTAISSALDTQRNSAAKSARDF